MPEMNDILRLLPMLKGIPAACLLALLLVGPLDLGGLTRATGYTQGRVLGALGMLETLGLVGLGSQGWMVVAEKIKFCATDSRVLETQSLESLRLESESLDSETQTQTQDSESVLKILILAQDLFGEPVLLPPGFEVEPQNLLALLAEAYTNRNRLRKPARVVAANLKEGRQPSRRFLLDPRAYLPAEFVRKLYKVFPVTESAFDDEIGEETVGGPADDLKGPVPQLPHDAAQPSESQRLWGAARDELERSLPKASFESYVRPVAAVDYDPQQGQLFLEAADGQSCVWLDRHLKRILERLMVGITGEAVEVVFLPPEADEGGAA